jgi:hypothetical protein
MPILQSCAELCPANGFGVSAKPENSPTVLIEYVSLVFRVWVDMPDAGSGSVER